MRIATVLLLLATLVIPAHSQVNGHVQVIDGKPILTVWGTHAERGYAAGYLTGVEGKEMFDDYIVGYCCGGSALTYGFMRSYYNSNFSVDAKYQVEADAAIQGMIDAGVDLRCSALWRDIDATDLLVSNAIVDLSILSVAELFACSSMSSWGSSTLADPHLHGDLVITRLLDWSKHPTLTDNPLMTVHFPAETDEQPWISIGYAGLYGALTALSESGVSASLNMGNNESGSGGTPYHPILLTVRNGIEAADYDGDGEHTPEDVLAAIEDRTRGIDTIVHVTKNEGVGSRPIVIESNNENGVAVRDCSDNTAVPGDNLVATNHFRVLYPPVYCYRYDGIVDSLVANTEISCERSWTVMSGAAGTFGSNIQCIQYVESEGLLLWAMDTYTEPAYMQNPTELRTQDLFGCPLGIDAAADRPLLMQNHPNPFNPTTRIAFVLPVESECTLSIYDVRGRRVRTLVDGRSPAGERVITWDGTSDAAAEVSSGIYLCRLETDQGVSTMKMILLK